MVKRCLLIICLVSSLISLNLWSFSEAQPGESTRRSGHHRDLSLSHPWQNKTFTRFTYEEDIKDTLRAMAQLLGVPMTFGRGISETITMEFKDMPLKDAFDFLIDQYDLAYTLDARSIHVYKPGLEGLQDLLLSLRFLGVEEAKSAIERFGFVKKEVRIVFDPPSNTIFVTGPARDVGNIKHLIDSLEDSKRKQLEVRPEIRYFPLRYAKVNDTELTIGKSTVSVPGIVSVLTELLGLTRKGEETLFAGGPYEGRGRSPSLRGAQEPLVVRTSPLKGMIGAEPGTITSDPRTNRIIIRDYPEKLDEYGKIIQHLDQPTRMVRIDVTIIEASKDFSRELGVGHSVWTKDKNKRRRIYYGTSAEARDVFDEEFIKNDLTALTLIPLKESAAGNQISSYGLAGTFLYDGARWAMASVIALAESKGISKTLNKSSVLTMDNMEAIVEAKTIVTYKIQTGGDNPTVEDKDIEAGLVLRVTPHVVGSNDEDKMIELVVTAERSTFLATTTDDIPEKATTNLTTQAVVGDNATLVVGGLFENRYRKGETGVPCLMNVPGLGYLFKNAAATNPKTNILFFMTPKVITLDQIPYEGPAMIRKIQKYEQQLKEIDPDKRDQLIEKRQD